MNRLTCSPEASAAENADEPQPGTEPDVPSDGADEIGEAMIRQLPRTVDADRNPAP